MKHPEGIKGLEGRDPYGLVISMGRKVPGGRGVKDRDGFWAVTTFENEQKVRPLAPRFKPFNDAPAEHRRMLFGMLLYPRKTQNVTYRLSMKAFPKGYPPPHTRPHVLPVCEGDGETAVRWMQDEAGEEFANIKCPNEACEFRQMDPPACGPFVRLAFLIQWAKGDMPTPLTRFESHGWGTTRNIIGFFNHVEEIAQGMGINPADINWMGMKFSLQLVQKTNAQKRRKWWEAVMSPETELGEFLSWQGERMQRLEQMPTLKTLPDMREENELRPDILGVKVGGE